MTLKNILFNELVQKVVITDLKIEQTTAHLYYKK